jgi:hypothetical protein
LTSSLSEVKIAAMPRVASDVTRNGGRLVSWQVVQFKGRLVRGVRSTRSRGELREFLIAEGVHPATVLDWFTDSLGFATYHPGPGE